MRILFILVFLVTLPAAYAVAQKSQGAKEFIALYPRIDSFYTDLWERGYVIRPKDRKFLDQIQSIRWTFEAKVLDHVGRNTHGLHPTLSTEYKCAILASNSGRAPLEYWFKQSRYHEGTPEYASQREIDDRPGIGDTVIATVGISALVPLTRNSRAFEIEFNGGISLKNHSIVARSNARKRLKESELRLSINRINQLLKSDSLFEARSQLFKSEKNFRGDREATQVIDSQARIIDSLQAMSVKYLEAPFSEDGFLGARDRGRKMVACRDKAELLEKWLHAPFELWSDGYHAYFQTAEGILYYTAHPTAGFILLDRRSYEIIKAGKYSR